MRRPLLAMFLIVVLGAAGTALVWEDLNRPQAPPPGGVLVRIERGTPFRVIAQQLHGAGVLRHPTILVLWARWSGADRLVQSGEHRIEGVLSPLELLERLQSASGTVQWVTIPEGFTAAQIAAALEEKGFGGRDVFSCALSDPLLLRELGLPASGAEGYLFPDTYAFTWAMEPAAIVRTMVARFRQQTADLTGRREAAGLSEEEMVTLASVIEKETARPEERPLIAGVFHNRLRLGMPLQSDPTVIYGLRDFDGNLTRADLADPSPYNTYVHRGLPAGPIANPGRAALEAAVAPAATDALYFVSRNDGSHQFSKSIEEHSRAVRRYQRRR